MRHLHLDLLAVDDGPVKVLDGPLGIVLPAHGDEGVPLASDKHVQDGAGPGELVFKDALGTGAVHAVDEHLDTVASGHDGDFKKLKENGLAISYSVEERKLFKPLAKCRFGRGECTWPKIGKRR